MTSNEFTAILRALTADDLERIAGSLDGDSVTDEVEWWRATIAIDRAIRHRRCGREAGRAAADAIALVASVAARPGRAVAEETVNRVARAAADVARGLAAGPGAEPIVNLLLQHWSPVTVEV